MTAIYTLWARLPNDEGAWMIAAEDEWCWEGDPERCEQKFKEAREKVEADGNIVREVWINIDQQLVEERFSPGQIDGGPVMAGE